MLVIETVADFRRWGNSHLDVPTVLIPLFGELGPEQKGLILTAQKCSPQIVASYFCNPLSDKKSSVPQSNSRASDLGLLSDYGVSVLFAPLCKDLYPAHFSTHVEEDQVSERHCQDREAGRYRDITTLIIKLSNVIQPSFIVVPQKEVETCAVIEKIVSDLNIPAAVVRSPVVREPDGLAVSASNSALSTQDRQLAASIFECLKEIDRIWLAHDTTQVFDFDELEDFGAEFLLKRGFCVEKVECIDAVTLEYLSNTQVKIPCRPLIRISVYLGNISLQDNYELSALDATYGLTVQKSQISHLDSRVCA